MTGPEPHPAEHGDKLEQQQHRQEERGKGTSDRRGTPGQATDEGRNQRLVEQSSGRPDKQRGMAILCHSGTHEDTGVGTEEVKKEVVEEVVEKLRKRRKVNTEIPEYGQRHTSCLCKN